MSLGIFQINLEIVLRLFGTKSCPALVAVIRQSSFSGSPQLVGQSESGEEEKEEGSERRNG